MPILLAGKEMIEMSDKITVDFKVGGSVILRVKCGGGIHQRIVFRMLAEPSPAGPYKLLYTDRQIPINELSALADKVDLPIRAQKISVFPKGKTSLDFKIT